MRLETSTAPSALPPSSHPLAGPAPASAHGRGGDSPINLALAAVAPAPVTTAIWASFDDEGTSHPFGSHQPDGPPPDNGWAGFIASQNQRAAPNARASLPRPTSEAQVSSNIRGFFSRFNVTVVADGHDVTFTIPFHMNDPATSGDTLKALKSALGSCREARSAGFIVSGRATPEQLRDTVVALAAKNPAQFAPPKSTDEVRAYLESLGVGIDCAGSVQLALREATGINNPKTLGLRDRMNENLGSLHQQKAQFSTVPGPEAARAGDIITLRPPPDDTVGHTVIVAERGLVVVQQNDPLLSQCGSFALAPGDRLVKLCVASSWGTYPRGPDERIRCFNSRTQAWGEILRTDPPRIQASRMSGPYDHELRGIYRSRYCDAVAPSAVSTR